METKQIIPCLDIKDGKVVKGIHFVNLKDAGDPVENAVFYEKDGADELAFLDINATVEGRKTTVELVRQVNKAIHIPLTVGGGIKELKDIAVILSAGASKVSINTAAIEKPALIKDAAKKFGSGKIIVAIDAKRFSGKPGWEVYTYGGRKPTGQDAVEWAKKFRDLGAGELLPTSIDADGTKAGYDLELTRALAEATGLPVIASGGAGSLEDLFLALTKGKAQAALAASIFHFREVTIRQAKEYLKSKGVSVRM